MTKGFIRLIDKFPSKFQASEQKYPKLTSKRITRYEMAALIDNLSNTYHNDVNLDLKGLKGKDHVLPIVSKIALDRVLNGDINATIFRDVETVSLSTLLIPEDFITELNEFLDIE